MTMQKFSKMRGDTLTEVMFATAVAALCIVLAMTSMNRSLAQSQMAVETTLTRQSIDAQADMLRYVRDEYMQNKTGTTGEPKIWRDIVSRSVSSASTFGTCYSETVDPPNGSFFVRFPNVNGVDDMSRLELVTDASAFEVPETNADIGSGIWVEAVRGGASSGVSYLDLHIRACWEPPYSGPEATMGTIVRLYYE